MTESDPSQQQASEVAPIIEVSDKGIIIQSQETKHDKWFRAEVEAALAEADDPNTEWVSHEIVRQEMAEEREKLRALVATEQKAAPTL